MKKEKLLTVGLWLVVGYAVALLIYCTFYFVFKKSDAYISAYGSILSAIATFAASFVAVYLFNDWKEQHNIQIRSESAKEILKLYEEVFFKMLTLDNFYQKSQFELQKIISNQPPEQHQNAATEVYRELEQSINSALLDITANLDWILFKTTNLTISINEPDILAITVGIRQEISTLMQPLRTQANATMSSREFDRIYKRICEDFIILANQKVESVVLVFKKYIEA